MSNDSKDRGSFRREALGQSARAAVKAAWWTGIGAAARMITRPTKDRPKGFNPSGPAPASGTVMRSWLSAFQKDAADVAAGLYPAMGDGPGDAGGAIREALDFLADAREVNARRRRRGGVEARTEAPAASAAYPNYYRQNFHYQSGGWFTEESARRYDAQVEALFSGTAAAMRRRGLSLLARAWRAKDTRGVRVLDLACGSGGFLGDLKAAFPRAEVMGVDLSAQYLVEARRRSGVARLAQANAEKLPFADASLDAVTCVYLFHELPPKVRPVVAGEIARVLKPGGMFVLVDSVQPVDEPELERLLEAFPAYFHEPYYGTYSKLDLAGLFGAAGLTLEAEDKAFLTKAMRFRR